MQWKILEDQPELRPYAGEIEARMERLRLKAAELLLPGQSLRDFASGYLFFGLHKTNDGWVYREWAPGAEALHLVGDFNGWNTASHPLHRLSDGAWEIFLPGRETLWQLCNYKVAVTANGKTELRIPLYASYVRQNPENYAFCPAVWEPEYPFEWQDGGFFVPKEVPPLIYEAHIGMASEEGRVATYREFADNILPRIAADGYNTVQLMAIAEHPYYGSFGYHVSNFYAPSSRFGTPDDLRYLVNEAHRRGLRVLLDLVHSHAVKNTAEGIAGFDGTDTQFFKNGAAGYHPAWDSRVFDYGKNGVIHFLLSNLKYWLEDFHVDGFRFDGVGSMLYRDHGLGRAFSGMDCYFSGNTDADAVTYLQLAAELVHQVKPDALLIAEDVSAMPGLCRPVSEGGLGFDYRLSMGLPDFYIRSIKERRFGDWEMDKLCWELIARRTGEKVIAYAESHDQALVGDQTIMFRLCGEEIYRAMGRNTESLTVSYAMGMHKLLRLVTLCAGGEGYLAFMGNEFGHPDWIDFPREGNGWSYEHARRLWSLADDRSLRYSQLGDFDKAMIWFARERGILSAPVRCLMLRQTEQLIAFERGGYVFAFNLHPERSETAFPLCGIEEGTYKVVLSSDEAAFGGGDRISYDYIYSTAGVGGFMLYLPAQTAAVLKKL